MASWSLSCLMLESSTSVNICRKICVPDFFLVHMTTFYSRWSEVCPQHPLISAPVPRHKCDLLHNTSFPRVRIMQRWPTNSPWDWYTHTPAGKERYLMLQRSDEHAPRFYPLPTPRPNVKWRKESLQHTILARGVRRSDTPEELITYSISKWERQMWK